LHPQLPLVTLSTTFFMPVAFVNFSTVSPKPLETLVLFIFYKYILPQGIR